MRIMREIFAHAFPLVPCIKAAMLSKLSLFLYLVLQKQHTCHTHLQTCQVSVLKTSESFLKGRENIWSKTNPDCHTTKIRVLGHSLRKCSLTTPSSSSETPFWAGIREAGQGIEGLCFLPSYSVFIEKEFITVHNHEII